MKVMWANLDKIIDILDTIREICLEHNEYCSYWIAEAAAS